MMNRRQFIKDCFRLAGGGVLGWLALDRLGVSRVEANMVIRGSGGATGNDFSGDPNCVALWRFEDTPGFTADSKGNNDLTNSGADEENTVVKEGAQSAKFIAANSDYMAIADADQDAGFPFRYADGGNAERSFSYCMRYYASTMDTEEHYILARWNEDNDGEAWWGTGHSVWHNYAGFGFRAGYNGGYDVQDVAYSSTLPVAGRWYSIAVTYNDSTKQLRMRIYDHTAEGLLDDDKVITLSNNIVLLDVGFFMGCRGDVTAGTAKHINGILDEVVVFNRVLSVSEIDDIRAGTFS